VALKLASKNATAIKLAGLAQAAADDALTLPVPFIAQDPHKNLCWAACCAMVNTALVRSGGGGDYPTTVCDVATTVFERDCCGPSDACDVRWNVLHAYQQCGVDCQPIVWAAFDWDAIVHEIGVGRRPIEVYYRWGSQAHVALITGYWKSKDLLYVLDPLYQYGWTHYDNVLSAYGMGRWAGTYYGIGRTLD
jgi:hypothetical protein